jgi:hypothetical protein
MQTISAAQGKNLQLIFSYKLKIARRAHAEQMRVVNEGVEALAREVAELNKLKNTLAVNSEYMQQDDVSSHPDKMLRAIKYKEQIDYDIERQSFYTSMAQDELANQNSILSQRLAAIQKLEAKLENITRLTKRSLSYKELIEEAELEESFSLSHNRLDNGISYS